MENVIGTKTAIKILSILLRNPKKEFKETELLRESKTGKGAGSDAITGLSSLNVLKIKRVGKTKVVSLNVLNPLTSAFRRLFDTHRLLLLPESRISAILFFREKTYSHSRAIVLFGSLASEDYDEKSDIDLLVVTDEEKWVTDCRNEVSEMTGEKINVHFLRPSDAKKEFVENILIGNALSNGILVYGGDYVREVIRHTEDLKEFEFLREELQRAWKHHAQKNYGYVNELFSGISDNMAFLACKLEGLEARSRKDAVSKIKKSKEFGFLGDIDKLKTENIMETLENAYIKLLNKTIMKGEGIERRVEK